MNNISSQRDSFKISLEVLLNYLNKELDINYKPKKDKQIRLQIFDMCKAISEYQKKPKEELIKIVEGLRGLIILPKLL